jgi:hypothetical protein
LFIAALANRNRQQPPQARVTLTQHPYGNEMVRFVRARSGPESLASIARNTLKKRNNM